MLLGLCCGFLLVINENHWTFDRYNCVFGFIYGIYVEFFLVFSW